MDQICSPSQNLPFSNYKICCNFRKSVSSFTMSKAKFSNPNRHIQRPSKTIVYCKDNKRNIYCHVSFAHELIFTDLLGNITDIIFVITIIPLYHIY